MINQRPVPIVATSSNLDRNSFVTTVLTSISNSFKTTSMALDAILKEKKLPATGFSIFAVSCPFGAPGYNACCFPTKMKTIIYRR